MVRNRQSKTLLHFVERLIFSQWILNLVVTGFEPTTIRFADGSINRHAIRPVGPRQKPFSSTSEEDPKIAKRTSLNRQFLGQVAGGRVGPGRAGSPIAFFYKDQTSEPLRGKNLIKGREGGEINAVLFWNIRSGARIPGLAGGGSPSCRANPLLPGC